MSDDKQIRGAADRQRINVSESYEVTYWSAKLKISRDQLKEAVKVVGDQADDVEAYVRKQPAKAS